MCSLCISGLSEKEAAIDVANTMTVETAIAKAMTPRDKERNQHGKRYSLAQLSALSPDVDWAGWFEGIGLKGVGTKEVGYLVVKNADFLVQVTR
jgi:predicted metalloendopeptidase